MLYRAAGTPPARPRIIAVDGRGASGKSTLASLLHDAVPASVVVHTDDVAWHHSFFDWADILLGCVLQPILEGRAVSYRPPAWIERGRPGAIHVPLGLEMVIIEGVGAGRRELGHLIDAVVWVQSDFAEAERRGIARDIAQKANGDPDEASVFWHTWMAEELPFLEHHRPWERACVIIAGTPARVGQGSAQVVLAHRFHPTR